ncbi:MAG: PD40 domain-containing protein [Deltaproteobacteria bacterium]|nr:PD40 domain-containing protein [Deltaproteobacteria bacterium]
MRALLLVLVTGCAVDVAPVLTVEPSAIDLTVALGTPPAPVPVHVYDGNVEIAAQLELTGAPVGSVAGGAFASDGLTGGAATVKATVGSFELTVPVTVHVVGWRIADGTPAGAEAAFAAAPRVAFDGKLDPPDGAVIPPNLGALAIAFAAPDTDDAHEIRITAPYLDLAVLAPSRRVELTADEWTALHETATAVDLEVASVATAAPIEQHVAHARVEIASLDASPVVFGGITGSEAPGLWRYDFGQAAAAPLFAKADGTCFGCHVAVSRDGKKIAAAMLTTDVRTLGGAVVDTQSGNVLAWSDAASASPWATAAFDPGGALVTAWMGALSVREADSGALRATVATEDAVAAPAISPDGTLLAYVSLDAGPGSAASQPAGNALKIRRWNTAEAKVGVATELFRDGGGVELPQFSSDGRWIAYAHSQVLPDRVAEAPLGASAIRTDGLGTNIALTSDPLDKTAQWASPVGSSRGEPMVWIAVVSQRALGGDAAPQQLWLEAFYPERGIVTPPFHLPGQPAALQVLHGPVALLPP